MDAPTDGEFYNIEFLDTSRPFFIMEGPIDSCFVKNSIAIGGTGGVDRLLREYPQVKDNWHNAIFVWDNFLLDDAGKKMLEYTSSSGYPYFDWSKVEFNSPVKDINDLVLHGKNVPINDDFTIDPEYIISRTVRPKLGNSAMRKLDSIINNIQLGF